MNGLDITFIIIFSLSAILGLWKGITKGFFSLISIIAGVTIASRYYYVFSISIHDYIKSPLFSNILGFIVIFIVIALIVNLIGVLIKKLMGLLALDWIDHLGGLLFGLLRGLVISTIIIILMSKFPFKFGEELINNSILSKYLLQISKTFCYLLPKEFYYTVKSYL
jgi:membrane protein required for colicin V production